MKANRELHQVPDISDIVIHEPRPCGCSCRIGQDTSLRDLQERVVRHCAPTLAGLKCGSMFRVCCCLHGIIDHIEDIHSTVAHKGVRMDVLSSDGCGCLLYVYRPSLLEERLGDADVRSFLDGYGYTSYDAGGALEHLKERFSTEGMPAEIGVFLDYPMEDVKGYIEHGGRNCLSIGCWKVYGDVDAAEKRFDCYRRCRDVYCRRFTEGYGLDRLSVRC